MKFEMVLLAAGSSVRYGENKLLSRIGEKRMYQYPLELAVSLWREPGEIAASLDRSSASLEICHITVVSRYEEIRQSCLEYQTEHVPITYVSNDHSEEGVSSSIRMALKRIREYYAAQLEADYHVVFLVCDQPALRTWTVRNLLSEYARSGRQLGCIAYQEDQTKEPQTGNPCIFGKRYMQELEQLQGDTGGKKVLLKHLRSAYCYCIQDQRELEDIDYKINNLWETRRGK